MAVVTQTDRTKSVRNRCVIEVFGGVCVLSRCFLDLSVGEGAFVKGLSQISSFFPFDYQASVNTILNISKLCIPCIELLYLLHPAENTFIKFPLLRGGTSIHF